jgi:hypothetical protein
MNTTHTLKRISAGVEGPPSPAPLPIFRTREECERALGFICVFAP